MYILFTTELPRKKIYIIITVLVENCNLYTLNNIKNIIIISKSRTY